MGIVVIGSGFGGLAVAVRLQAGGHDVTLLDKRDKPGGRAYVYEQDGFTFDGGPAQLAWSWPPSWARATPEPWRMRATWGSPCS